MSNPDAIMCQDEASIVQLLSSSGASEVERTLKTLNGYHEDIIKALRNAASHRETSTPGGSTSALNEELLRRGLVHCTEGYPDYKRSSSKENVCEQVSLLWQTVLFLMLSCFVLQNMVHGDSYVRDQPLIRFFIHDVAYSILLSKKF